MDAAPVRGAQDLPGDGPVSAAPLNLPGYGPVMALPGYGPVSAAPSPVMALPGYGPVSAASEAPEVPAAPAAVPAVPADAEVALPAEEVDLLSPAEELRRLEVDMRGGPPQAAASPPTLAESEIVFGIPCEDTGQSKVVKRVMILAAAAATFYTCHFISDLMRGRYNSPNAGGASTLWTATSTLMIELSIPACGYYGALHSNRQLTCCFCSCNLFITIVTVMQFIRIELRIGEIDGQCDREQDPQSRATCEVWTSNGAEKGLAVFGLVAIICLGSLAFWFGNALYQRLAHDFATVPPPVPLIGEVISLASVGFIGAPSAVQPAATGAPVAPAPGAGVVRPAGTSGVVAALDRQPFEPQGDAPRLPALTEVRELPAPEAAPEAADRPAEAVLELPVAGTRL